MTELFINQLWYRSIAKTKQLPWGDNLDVPTSCSSPIASLPQEIVDIIISYLFCDVLSLIACSLTCHSLYAAAVRHLYYSLTAVDQGLHPWDEKYLWPNSLRQSYKLGLLPLVRRFRFCSPVPQSPSEFTPKLLNGWSFRYFSALTNLKELGIDRLNVSSFMPDIRLYFRHFALTLRFLALREPKGSCRQILYLVGLFPNLQDLKLCYPFPIEEEETSTDSALIPSSTPPLDGRLTLTSFTREKLVKDMIVLFGGLRFRYLDLFEVNCVRRLLDACADSLETLRLYPTDSYCKVFSKNTKWNGLNIGNS